MARKHKPEGMIGKLREAENARLRRAVSDLTLDKLILQEASGENSRALRADGAVSIISGE